MRYAMIKNGVIDNIIEADYTNAQSIRVIYEYDEAINVDNYSVRIGDKYENGFFLTGEDQYDENGNLLIPAGTIIERRLSDEEYIKILEERLNVIQMALDEVILNGGITPNNNGGVE